MRAAEWIADKVRRSGGEAELVPYGERPMVVGEIRASNPADAPTVLCYGHFDVQPPAPLELWESDPFEATIRDEWLYARGVADDKGQLWMLLHAAGLLAAEGALPINIRLVSDGEEEVGGQSIVEFLEQDERGADACVIFDGSMESRHLPAISVATRGLAAFNLRVKTGRRDLHSGMYGNAALNAIHALNETLTGILPRDGRVPEPLRVGIVPATDEERAGWAKQPAGAEVLREAGAVPYDPRAADEFYLRTTAETSVDVNGILGGKPGPEEHDRDQRGAGELHRPARAGPDARAVVPRSSGCCTRRRPRAPWSRSRSCRARPGPASSRRLAGDQDRPGRLRARLRRPADPHPLGRHAADHARARRQGDPDDPDRLRPPESNVHSPNERMLVEFFPRGVATIKELYTRLGNLS